MIATQSLCIPNAQKPNHRDIILIGGGSTASTFFIRLADEIRQNPDVPRNFTIHCYDKSQFPSGGIAYGEASINHILNSVSSEMSPWNINAFHDFCIEKGHGICTNIFNARRDYRDFLQLEVKGAWDYLKSQGVRILNHAYEIKIEQSNDGFDLYDANYGHRLLRGCHPNQLVLAVGYGPNTNFQSLQNRLGPDRYAHSLYGFGGDGIFAKKSLKHNPHIVFIGCGPALYDCVNDLYGAGITSARLTIVSGFSHGPLPVRDVLIENGEVNIRPENLLSMGLGARSHDLVQAVSKDFERAASKRRVSLDILSHLTPILKSVDADEAAAFLKSSVLGRIRHAATPVPHQSHAKLCGLNPTFIPTHLCEEDVRIGSNGSLWIRRGNVVITNIDMIINGTGHGRHNAPILESMKRQGLARVDKNLGVLKTDITGYRLVGSNIACLGPATHAGCDGVESFDIPAKALARELVL